MSRHPPYRLASLFPPHAESSTARNTQQQWVFLADSGVTGLVEGEEAQGCVTTLAGTTEPKQQDETSTPLPPPAPPPPPPSDPPTLPHGSRWGGGHLLAVRICGTPERVEFVPAAETMAAAGAGTATSPPPPPKQRPAVASAVGSGASALQLIAFRHLVLEGYDEQQRVWQVGVECASQQVVRRRTCL